MQHGWLVKGAGPPCMLAADTCRRVSWTTPILPVPGASSPCVMRCLTSPSFPAEIGWVFTAGPTGVSWWATPGMWPPRWCRSVHPSGPQRSTQDLPRPFFSVRISSLGLGLNCEEGNFVEFFELKCALLSCLVHFLHLRYQINALSKHIFHSVLMNLVWYSTVLYFL